MARFVCVDAETFKVGGAAWPHHHFSHTFGNIVDFRIKTKQNKKQQQLLRERSKHAILFLSFLSSRRPLELSSGIGPPCSPFPKMRRHFFATFRCLGRNRNFRNFLLFRTFPQPWPHGPWHVIKGQVTDCMSNKCILAHFSPAFRLISEKQ